MWADSEKTHTPDFSSLTLGEIFEKYDIPIIDILKLDCEGSEYTILDLAKKQGVLERINCIVMELHVNPEKNRYFHEIFKYLEHFYNIRVVKVKKDKESRMIYAYKEQM